MDELIRIEEKEKEMLFKLGWIFKDSLDDFSTSVDRSLRYLDKIVLPIIMASKEDKSYNPFSEIIEKYVLHILIRKFEREGYSLLPLGYSADLTLENDQHILSIDIKTANIDNPSDFKETGVIGINQLTHVAKLGIDRKKWRSKFLPYPYFVYPSIPPYYKLENGRKKLIFTYELMFVYPSYKDLIDDIRSDYISLFNFFNEKVKNVLIPIISSIYKVNNGKAKKLLEKKPPKATLRKDELITESLIRGIFIHGEERENILKSLTLSEKDFRKINEFEKKLADFIEKLQKRDIKPIAIIAISLPNGLLKEKYLDKFVSGKNYAKSARYHYEAGVFEVIKEKTGKEFPRVIFVALNMDSLDKLKKYFDRIAVLDYQLKVL